MHLLLFAFAVSLGATLVRPQAEPATAPQAKMHQVQSRNVAKNAKLDSVPKAPHTTNAQLTAVTTKFAADLFDEIIRERLKPPPHPEANKP